MSGFIVRQSGHLYILSNMSIEKQKTDTAAPPQEVRKRSFAPIVDNSVRLLVLGSLPGELSLAHGQYYANPQNRFWHLMSHVIVRDLVAMQYTERLQTLLAHRVGLWDVVAEARRDGSLDSRIRERDDNDLVGLAAGLPHLTTIAFNGATAARIGMKNLGPSAERYEIVKLPSSSPAFTMAFAEKARAWAVLMEALGATGGQ
jgi:hypoxanthine-DNA glycosylase